MKTGNPLPKGWQLIHYGVRTIKLKLGEKGEILGFDKDNKPVDITKFGPNYVTMHRRLQFAMKKKTDWKSVGVKTVTGMKRQLGSGCVKSSLLFKRDKSGITNVTEDSLKNKTTPEMFQPLNDHRFPIDNYKEVYVMIGDVAIKHVLVEKKWLEQASSAIRLAITLSKQALKSYPKMWTKKDHKKSVAIMEMTLKNIGVK
jgi:hypothetical protein